MAKEKKEAPFDTQEILARVHKVTGQSQGIERMIKSGRPIEPILLQISAARSALQRLGQALLEMHLEKSISEAANGKITADAALKNVTQAVDYFCRTK